MVWFVIGSPCSGKTTAIEMLSEAVKYHVEIADERAILLNMASDSRWRTMIRPIGSNSFQVLSARVYDHSLRRLAGRLSSMATSSLTVVEFSRPQYSSALDLLRFAIPNHQCGLLHVTAPRKVCLARNITRAEEAEGYLIPQAELTKFFSTGELLGIDPKNWNPFAGVRNDSQLSYLRIQIDTLVRRFLEVT